MQAQPKKQARAEICPRRLQLQKGFFALSYINLVYFKSAHSALNHEQSRYLCSRLGPGCLAAHRSFRLGLLHS
jgi:hypothetical protein